MNTVFWKMTGVLILTISIPVTVLPRTLDRAAGDHFTDHGMFTSKMMQKNSAMRGLIIIWRCELGCDNIIPVNRIAGPGLGSASDTS